MKNRVLQERQARRHKELKHMGERIKARREAMKLSQEELADRIRVTPGMISHYERGRHMPTVEVLSNLAMKLGVSVAHLLYGEQG